MAERLLAACLLIAAALPCAGQTKSRPTGPARPQPRAGVVSELFDRAGSVEEPTLRVFLHLHLAKLLWEDRSGDSDERAAAAASEVLETLQKRGEEVPHLYRKLFRRELLALAATRDPQLAARLAERYHLERTGREQIETAYAMLDTPGGADGAVERARRSLRGGESPDLMFAFFLHRLAQVKPAALAPVLSDLLALEEQRPGALTLETLSHARQFCLAADAPAELKTRFIAAALGAARAAVNTPDRAQAVRAYDLLRFTLPDIAKAGPALHAQASALLAVLAADVPQMNTERAEVSSRIYRGEDVLGQMLSEAEASKDAGLRERLLVDAAQFALGKGQLREAIEIVMRIESGGKIFPEWRDQFLGEVVDRALAKGEPPLAEGAAAKIGGGLERAAALQKIALHFFESKDLPRARETMGEVVKLAQAAEDGVAKARALLQTIPAFARIDGQRTHEAARSAIRIINALPEPAAGEGRAARDEHAGRLMAAAYQLVPAFRSLARHDEQGALALAESVRHKGLKAVAVFGVHTAAPPAAARAK